MSTSSVEADPIVRVRLDLSYDGTDFAGWARQPDRRTVQGVLEAAIATVTRVDGVALTVAGRTDAGVHATGQVAHVDLPAAPDDRFVRRVNGVLPADVHLRGADAVAADFDARFAALWRRYRYRLCDLDESWNPLRRRDTVAWPRRLDVDRMDAAAARMTGLRDFAAYCKHRDGATTVRDLLELSVQRADEAIVVEVRADAFCHSMVRSLVGALLAVGEGRREVAWPTSLLDLDRRVNDVTVAPARGLTLVEVHYPPPAQWAARASQARRLRSRGEIGDDPPGARA